VPHLLSYHWLMYICFSPPGWDHWEVEEQARWTQYHWGLAWARGWVQQTCTTRKEKGKMGGYWGEEKPGAGQGTRLCGWSDKLGKPEGQGQRRQQRPRQHQDHPQQIPVWIPQLVCFQVSIYYLRCKLGKVCIENHTSHALSFKVRILKEYF